MCLSWVVRHGRPHTCHSTTWQSPFLSTNWPLTPPPHGGHSGSVCNSSSSVSSATVSSSLSTNSTSAWHSWSSPGLTRNNVTGRLSQPWVSTSSCSHSSWRPSSSPQSSPLPCCHSSHCPSSWLATRDPWGRGRGQWVSRRVSAVTQPSTNTRHLSWHGHCRLASLGEVSVSH